MYSQRASSLPPCRCGSGNYCERHRTYGGREAPQVRLSRRHEDDDPRLIQQCGGGRRIIRKRLGD